MANCCNKNMYRYKV